MELESVNRPEVKVPVHVAIIMDGNGRWAKQRGLPRAVGHRKGAEAVRGAVKSAQELGVRYLTLYSFSSENWRRPAEEVADLMGLLRHYLRNEIKNLSKNNIRLRVIGERRGLDKDIQVLIEDAQQKTAGNTGVTVVIALNYGARQEITAAARSVAQRYADGEISLEEITEDFLSSQLYTGDIPDPDLLIRTSGELRISNFLLWQLAYSEMIFLDCYWPDFDKQQFQAAIEAFSVRERRFGATVPLQA